MALGRHHTPMPAGGGIHPISSVGGALLITTQLSSFSSGLHPLNLPYRRVFGTAKELFAADLFIFRVGRPSADAAG